MAQIARASVTVRFAKNFVQDLAGRADPKMRALAEAAAVYQRAHIPVGHDSSNGRPPGYAQSRIAVRVTVGPTGRKVYEVGSDAVGADGFPYPLVLDVGSRPHEISAHGNYSLHNAATGQFFGQTVHHPGVQGNNWCRGSVSVIHGHL